MTIVYGQIESLTRIKETLNQKGINRFNSIDDINEFKRNSDLERQNISNQIEHDLKIEIDGLQADKNTEKAKTLKMHKTNPDRRRPAVAVKAVVIPCTPLPCHHGQVLRGSCSRISSSRPWSLREGWPIRNAI